MPPLASCYSVRLPYLAYIPASVSFEFGKLLAEVTTFDSSASVTAAPCFRALGAGVAKMRMSDDNRETRDDRFVASGPMRDEERRSKEFEAGFEQDGGRSPIVLRDSAISSAVRFAHPHLQLLWTNDGILHVY